MIEVSGLYPFPIVGYISHNDEGMGVYTRSTIAYIIILVSYAMHRGSLRLGRCRSAIAELGTGLPAIRFGRCHSAIAELGTGLPAIRFGRCHSAIAELGIGNTALGQIRDISLPFPR